MSEKQTDGEGVISEMESTASDVDSQVDVRAVYRNLRIWPAVFFLIAMVIAKLLPSMIENGPSQIWMSAAFGPLLASLFLLLWWLIGSRARWQERILGLLGLALAFGLAAFLLDSTMLGPAILVLTIPVGVGGFTLATICLSKLHSPARTGLALIVAFLGFGYTDLLRAEGMWGDFAFDLHWRWSPDAEDRLVASQKNDADQVGNATYSADEVNQWMSTSQWPGFRGGNRDSRQSGVSFASDWQARPPEELWRIAVGPGWSSFAVAGQLLYTQEQVSDRELIACYDASTGRKIWAQAIESRFDDPLGGPGPRATPTLAEGGVFSLGGQGWLSRVDPQSGALVWKKDLRVVADCSPPMWGFCSSPIVVDGRVIVYAGGKNGKGLMAFDAADGELVWSVDAGENSYASPQLSTIGDQSGVLMLTGNGISIHDPDNGEVLFDYEWKSGGYRSLQPQVIEGNKVLLPSGMGTGTRLIEISSAESPWTAKELWTTLQLKPDYNDFVIHQGHLYGFDGGIFTCIDLNTGERRWKGGRYGKGQVLLLEDSGLLLITAEKGQLVVLSATPEEKNELFRMNALDGRTWNHPVVVGDRLYVRNSSEAVCYKLPVVTGQ